MYSIELSPGDTYVNPDSCKLKFHVTNGCDEYKHLLIMSDTEFKEYAYIHINILNSKGYYNKFKSLIRLLINKNDNNE